MTNKNKQKGDRAELEAARLLCLMTGRECRRKLGAGRQDDTGDIDGLPSTVVQVAAWKNVASAVNLKPLGAEQQRINAGAAYAFTMVKLQRAGWRIVLTPEQFAAYLRQTV